MSTVFEPEAGQMLYSGWSRYALPLFAEALLHYAINQICITYWNSYQERFSDRKQREFISWEFLEYRQFYYPRFDCFDDPLNPKEEAEKIEDNRLMAQPNFKFEDVCIYWYKHHGRGLSCNIEKSDTAWREWFDRLMVKIGDVDRRRHDERLHSASATETKDCKTVEGPKTI